MHWKAKAHVLALLSRAPGGHALYRWLQKITGTSGLRLRRDLDRAFELVELIQQAGGTVQGAEILEVGTGWRPMVPLVLALGGAKRVVTVDINPWLSLAYTRENLAALKPHLDEIADRCGANPSEVRARFQAVPTEVNSLDAILMPLGIEYRCPADARTTGLPNRSLDAVLSSNVLEHIPRDIQQDIHRETSRILKPSGLAVHRFNPEDHFATVDKKITQGNFLQFSSRDWLWYGGSGLAFHNRLRGRDYREMFASAGLEILVDRERTDERTLQAIESGTLPVHPEFAGYSPRELAINYMWLACRRPYVTHEAPVANTPSSEAGDRLPVST